MNGSRQCFCECLCECQAQGISSWASSEARFLPRGLGSLVQVATVARCIAPSLTPCTSNTLCSPLQASTYVTGQAVSASTPATGTISVGPPMSNTRLYVLDGLLRPVPLGAAGQLYISGSSLARGYLNRPEETSKAFLANPLAGGSATYSRMYATGDLARWLEDGTIQILGRVDNQVSRMVQA